MDGGIDRQAQRMDGQMDDREKKRERTDTFI